MEEEHSSGTSSVAESHESPHSEHSEPNEDEDSSTEMDSFRRYFDHILKWGQPNMVEEMISEHRPVQRLRELSVDAVVEFIQKEGCKNIITLAGAGISTSAGIPDFRSPGSGLYHNLQKYNLPQPQAIFDIGFFMQNPEPFFRLAKELLPGTFKPTPSHYFIKMLHSKGLLLRHYTQNIDTLERVAGLPPDKLVEAHGSFYTSHCVNCNKEHVIDWNKYFAENGEAIPICTDCPGVIKPDIVFFGEQLPERFRDSIDKDFPMCDLLIIMGSSLEVQPFASLVDRVPNDCPRLLINRERVGCHTEQASLLMRLAGQRFPDMVPLWKMMFSGLQLDQPDNVRDVAWLGNCDEGCQILADKLGWGDELRQIVKSEHERIDQKDGKVPPSPSSSSSSSSF